MNSTINQILVTGANGQLGREVCTVLGEMPHLQVWPTDVAELDITCAQAIDRFITEHDIDCIINCAAYTAVDAAESDADRCHLLNAEAPRLLAEASQTHGTRLIHISTDYVFDGKGCRPYREDDTVCPQSVYGATKALGEQAIIKTAPNHSIIIRTAWLYSPHGKNFVKTMLRLGAERDALRVVVDQVGTPTYALDLARAIAAIIQSEHWQPGIYHFTDEGAISWYDFTKAIHRLASINGCHVEPCLTADYPTPAQRPHFSVLDKTKIKSTFHITIPYWEDSLRHCIGRLMNQ